MWIGSVPLNLQVWRCSTLTKYVLLLIDSALQDNCCRSFISSIYLSHFTSKVLATQSMLPIRVSDGTERSFANKVLPVWGTALIFRDA